MSIRFLIQEHKKQKMKSESKTEDVAAKLHIASLEEKIEMSDGYKGDYLKAVADVAFLNARIYQLEQELADTKKSIKSVIQHYEDGAVYFERNYEAFYTDSFQDLMVDIYKKHDEAAKESSK